MFQPLLILTTTLLAVVHAANWNKFAGIDRGTLVEYDYGFNSFNYKYILGFGDVNGDRNNDVVVANAKRNRLEVLFFDKVEDKFVSQNKALNLDRSLVLNVILYDFNCDGKLDILVVTEEDSIAKTCNNRIYYGNLETLFDEQATQDLPVTTDQFFLLDYYGNMKPTLLGMNETKGVILISNFSPNAVPKVEILPDIPSFSIPHSNTFVDLDNDCMADLITTHEEANEKFVQIRLNGPNQFANPKDPKLILPSDTVMGSLVFQDFDGDGAIDVLFLTAGAIHIVYNKQTGYCGDTPNCKTIKNLCLQASDFGFDFNSSVDTKDHLIIPFTKLFGNEYSAVTQHMLPNTPIAPRLGDYNLDSFVDLTMTVTSNPSNLKDYSHYEMRLLENVACDSTNCKPDQINARRRTFSVVTSHDSINNLRGVLTANLVDLDGSNSFDLIVQAVGPQDSPKIVTLRNNLYQDAFILAANTIFSGIPDGLTRPDGSFVKRPYGASLVGVTYRYSIVDLNEYHQIRTSYQLAQSAYLQIVPGTALLGLGRVNSFISSFTVAITNREIEIDDFAKRYENWSSQIIPNSDLVIIPPNKQKEITGWTIELYINPGEYVLWVIVALLASIFILGALAFWFKRKELLEDEEEKKKALHAINFDAL